MADQSNEAMSAEMAEVSPGPEASLDGENTQEALEAQSVQEDLGVQEEQIPQEAQSVQEGENARPGRGGRERGQGSGRDGGRDLGGFRIRLSENEQRAAQLVQESFQLRSTVAALGFSIRTVAQLLEQGKLDELVEQQRAQGGGRPRVSREPSREPSREAVPVRHLERGERRGDDRGERRGGGGGGRPDPFARPSRPQQAAPLLLPVDDTPLVEVAPLLDPALLEGVEESILPVTIEPQP
jgi:hypothetical protein